MDGERCHSTLVACSSQNLSSYGLPMKYLVIGGGIAGVCCTEELCRLSESSESITLVTAGSVLKVRACFVG